MIRRYIVWRNSHAYDERLRRIVDRQTQPDAALEELAARAKVKGDTSWAERAARSGSRYVQIR